MIRSWVVALTLCIPVAAVAADELKVSQLEQDVRELRRQVQAQSQQIEELRMQARRPGELSARLPSPPASVNSPGIWLDASRWQRLQVGMGELEVIGLLGPPTSMRAKGNERVLLYAIEIGSSGFLGGSVTLHDRVVFQVQKPVLQ